MPKEKAPYNITIHDIPRMPAFLKDESGRIIASITRVEDHYLISIRKTDRPIKLLGDGRDMRLIIRSNALACHFDKMNLHFSELTLEGGPYYFQEGFTLHADNIRFDTPISLKHGTVTVKEEFHIDYGSPATFEDFTLVADTITIEDAGCQLQAVKIYAQHVNIENITLMKEVKLLADLTDATCRLSINTAQVNDLTLQTGALNLHATTTERITFHRFKSRVSRIDIEEGCYQFVDSQFFDDKQTSQQIAVFNTGLKTRDFQAWHDGNQKNPSLVGPEIYNYFRGDVTLVNTSFVTGRPLAKTAGAVLQVRDNSILAASKLHIEGLKTAPLEEQTELLAKDSVMVSEQYHQFNGRFDLEKTILHATSIMNIKGGHVHAEDESHLFSEKVYVDGQWSQQSSTSESTLFYSTKASRIKISDDKHNVIDPPVLRWDVKELDTSGQLQFQQVLVHPGRWSNFADIKHDHLKVVAYDRIRIH